MSFRPEDALSEYARLIVIAEKLHDAVVQRDAALVRALLDIPAASSIPREVREEALTLMALPAASFRAPMQLLQFHHRLIELSRETEHQERAQLELPFRAPRTIRIRPADAHERRG